jgi:hypothetical protein
MTDIVERLKREVARKSNLDRDKDLMIAAIREIETLRADVFTIMGKCHERGGVNTND